MPNKNLSAAKAAKNDEFYTQFQDIQREVNAYLEYDPDVFRGKTVLLPCDDPDWSNFTKFFAQNFEAFGLKKLISTSYALDSKPVQLELFPSMVEEQSELYDAEKTHAKGKLFVLDHDTNANGRIDFHDLEMVQYLEGDGDFRSAEVKRLRDEADIIVTNPPFSLFREFMAWLIEANKKFLIIGNMNAITYKEIFPLIMPNQLWLGATGNGSDMVFGVPKGATVAQSDRDKAARLGYVGDYTRLGNSCWYTNLDHGRRHQPLSLMTMADNIKFSRHKEIRGIGYRKYDNYDAIEVPYTEAIPEDWTGAMRIPKEGSEKLDPKVFELLPILSGNPDDEHYVYVRIRGGGYDTTCFNSTTYNEIQLPQGGSSLAFGCDGSANLLPRQVLPRAVRDSGTEPDFGKHGDNPQETGTSERRPTSLCDHRRGIETSLRPHPDTQEDHLRHILTSQYGYRAENLHWLPGVMGVPISFLDKFCPEQFEIVGISKTWFNFANKTYPEQIQMSANGRQSRVTKLNDGPVLKLDAPLDGETYYIVGDSYYTQTYARIFIRKRKSDCIEGQQTASNNDSDDTSPVDNAKQIAALAAGVL